MHDARPDPPVLVVGAGPTGLVLAAELIRHGTTCRIIDKAAGPTPLSKATTVQARSLEMLDDMGIVDGALSAGSKSHGVNIYHGTDRLLHVSYDELESPYPFLLNIPQSTLERVLGAFVASVGLTVEWNTELTGFTQDADGVTATLRTADGHEETVRTAWLVGSDGAHSIVRTTLEIPFAGKTYTQWFGLADTTLKWGLQHDELHGFVHPTGLFFAIPLPGEERFRVVMEAEEPPVDTELTLADFQAALDQRGPGNATLSDPGWITPFRVNARRAETYRVGRAFIAGDAAHIHSPTGGLGLNTGMQDGYNLAWKLGLVIRGLADPTLLDSYEIERIPVADAVLQLAGRLTTMLTLTNPVSQQLRNHLMPMLTGLGAVQHQIAVQDSQLSIDYDASPIVSEYHHGRFGPLRFAGGPKAGERAPDCGPLQTADGTAVRLYDLLRGVHHTLVLFGGPEPDAASWQDLIAIERAAREQLGDSIRVVVVVDGATLPGELAGVGGTVLDTEAAAHHRYQADQPTLYLDPPGRVHRFPQPTRRADGVDHLPAPGSSGSPRAVRGRGIADTRCRSRGGRPALPGGLGGHRGGPDRCGGRVGMGPVGLVVDRPIRQHRAVEVDGHRRRLEDGVVLRAGEATDGDVGAVTHRGRLPPPCSIRAGRLGQPPDDDVRLGLELELHGSKDRPPVTRIDTASMVLRASGHHGGVMSDPDLKIEAVIDDELRAWLLAERRYPVLAVNSADGPPSQSVMWFDLDPDDPDVVLMNTMVRRLKYRQLQADPRVSLLFEDGMHWFAMRGTVELDASFQPALDHIQRLARRYDGDPARYEGQERVIVRLRVEKVIRHD